VSLPESITNLRKLTTLLIDRNKLTYLPEHVCYMSSLRTLKLYENPIDELPESIAYNKKLRYDNIHPWIPEDSEEYSNQKRINKEESHYLYNLAKWRIFLRTYFALALDCYQPVTYAILLTTRPITFKKN
jgi:Leucine-rich repeat (LRR) protein